MNSPSVRISQVSTSNGLSCACRYCHASNPPMSPEYSVIVPTAERVAMNHFDRTSRASHSRLSSMRMSWERDFRHIANVLAMMIPPLTEPVLRDVVLELFKATDPSRFFDRDEDVGGGDQPDQRAVLVRDRQVVEVILLHDPRTLHQRPLGA